MGDPRVFAPAGIQSFASIESSSFMQQDLILAQEGISAVAGLGWIAVGGVGAAVFVAGAWWLAKWQHGPSSSAGSDVSNETDPLLTDKAQMDCDDDGVWRRSQPAEQEMTATAAAPGMVLAVLMAIPSILGSWCWPLLLVTMFGASSSVGDAEHREASHHITLGADLVLFGSVIYYIYSRTCGRVGPLLLATLGSLMILLDVCRHCCLDHGGVFWKPEQISMYKDDEGNLTAVGTFCKDATTLGVIFLFIGVLWFLLVPQPGVKPAKAST